MYYGDEANFLRVLYRAFEPYVQEPYDYFFPDKKPVKITLVFPVDKVKSLFSTNEQFSFLVGKVLVEVDAYRNSAEVTELCYMYGVYTACGEDFYVIPVAHWNVKKEDGKITIHLKVGFE